jgi:hypothetical protein
VSPLLWILLATLYLAMLWTLGITTFRKGRYARFFIGIVLPAEARRQADVASALARSRAYGRRMWWCAHP